MADREHHPDGDFLNRLRVGAGSFVVDTAFRSLARVGQMHPRAHPARHGVEVLRNIAYTASGDPSHLLDIYRPVDRPGPLPVVLYIHGGGFRILSKDTHWIMGLAFARRGFMVANISYRLSPRHRFPAAIEDSCAALVWLARNAKRYGGDMSRLIVAGESAGANLAASVALTTAYKRPEPFAREVFDTGLQLAAALPICGVLQVSDPGRFARRRRLSRFIADRLEEVHDAYLGGVASDGPGGIELADPLVILERNQSPDRPLPPFFAAVGTRDPLLDDTRRLQAACDKLGVKCKTVYYPGEVHAFHALVWRPNAVECWKESYRFVDECLAPLAATVVNEPERS